MEEDFYTQEELNDFLMEFEEEGCLFDDDSFEEARHKTDDEEDPKKRGKKKKKPVYGDDDLAEGVIVKRDNGYFVLSEDGKNLGGPYKTREEAMKRLRQIEHFKRSDGEDEDAEAGDTYHNRLSPDSPHNKKHRKIAKKCRKCGSTKNIDLHHQSGTRKNLSSTKNIIPLCRKCHRKLHQGKGDSKGGIINYLGEKFQDFLYQLEQDAEKNSEFYGRTIIHTIEDEPDMRLDAVACRIIPEDEIDDSILAKANIDKQKDLMYVAFKLVHAGTNKNKDTFIEKELKTAVGSPILKGINWGHSGTNIGVIYDTKFIQGSDNEPSHILAAAAIWKFKFPDLAKEMMSRFAQDELFFSMEVWFDDAQCSACHKVFGSKEEVCAHLQTRFEAYSTAHRILKNLTFGGAAVVEQPADPLAVGLALAKNKNDEKGVNLMSDELIQAKADVQVKGSKITELEATIAKLETNLTKANEEIEASRDEASKTFKQFEETKESLDTTQNRITELEKELAEAKKLADEKTKELEAIQAEAAATELATKRHGELVEAGFEIDKDSEGYAEHFENLKKMDESSFAALISTLKLVKKPAKAEAGPTQSAKASVRIPTGDSSESHAKSSIQEITDIFDKVLAAGA